VRKNNYRSAFEEAAWFVKGEPPGKYFNFLGDKRMKNVFWGRIGSVGGKKTEHPTEKYRWMADPVIERHSHPGNIVLDPFCGSGTFLEASAEFGRKYIGIENEQESYNECIARLKHVVLKVLIKQEKLF
jgi:DNA modification methylase